MLPLTSCLTSCTDSHIPRGAYLLAFSAAGITLDMDSFNLVRPSVNHWKTGRPPSTFLYPTSPAVHAGLHSSVPPLLCHTSPVAGPSPLSLELVAQRNPRDLRSPRSHPTRPPPDSTVLSVLCNSHLSE